MMDSIPTHPNQHNLFASPIWGYVLRNYRYPVMDFIDYILDLKLNTKSLSKSNFGGWHSECNLHEHGIFQEFCSSVLDITKDIASPYTSLDLDFLEMWAMVNQQHSYNAHHVHEGLLSGVFYLQVPEDSGKLIMCNPAVRSDSHPIRIRDYAIRPENLALIIFPSWLQHYVEPNKSNNERISISFNIGEKL